MFFQELVEQHRVHRLVAALLSNTEGGEKLTSATLEQQANPTRSALAYKGSRALRTLRASPALHWKEFSKRFRFLNAERFGTIRAMQPFAARSPASGGSAPSR
jgi:hypothetical protein